MGKRIKSDSFIVQGSILAIAGIVVRIIGLLYRIPLTNIIGEGGIGVYSTAYSVYNILLLISSYTLPLAVSRLVASRLALKQYINTRRIFICACFFALVSGGIMGIICFLGADSFAALMNMPQAALAIKTLAPTIFIMAFLGVLRGYFQGHGTMIPTAQSQVFEQIVNAAVSIIAGLLLFRQGAAMDLAQGTGDYYSSAYGAAGGTIGTGAGAATAFMFCTVLYTLQRRPALKRCVRDGSGSTERYPLLMKALVMTIFPVLLSSTVYQISSIIDQGIFGAYIQTDYKSIWGAYSGKYTVLIHVPTAIASALGSAVIPALAASAAKRDSKDLAKKSGLAIRFNMFIAIPATVGMAVLARPIMDMLFSSDNTLAAGLMMAGSSAILFTALSTIGNSVLQGMGNIWIPVRNAAIALVSHIAFLALILWVFDAGIYGVVIANIFFYIVMSVLNIISLSRKIGYRQNIYKTFVSPLVSSAIMGLAAWLIYLGVHAVSGSNALSVLLAVLLGVIIYLEALILTGGIVEKDLNRVEIGRKMVRMLKKIKLMR